MTCGERATVRDMAVADLDAAVAVHMGSFRGEMNTRLGTRYVHRFLRWFVASAQGVALAGVVDGHVAGYVVGAPVGYARAMNRDLLWAGAWGLLTHPWVFTDKRVLWTVWARMRVLLDLSAGGAPTVEQGSDPCMSLVGIGVAPWAQGKGLGHSLVRAFENEAANNRIRTLRLTVYRSNQGARMLYERAGWTMGDPAGSDTVYYFRQL
jgi:ribosomal protein S18 acetylase RimI-like enzyme